MDLVANRDKLGPLEPHSIGLRAQWDYKDKIEDKLLAI